MSSYYSVNYGLAQPTEDDEYNILEISRNFGIIDEELKKNSDSADVVLENLQGQIEDIKSRSFGINTINLYVDANSGDDENEGSQFAPFKTIKKAVSCIYSYSPYYTTTINIAKGTYTENVNISKVGGAVNILGSNTGNTIINGAIGLSHVIGCTISNITINIPVLSSQGIFVTAISRFECTKVNINGQGTSSGYGIISDYSNVFFSNGTIKDVSSIMLSRFASNVVITGATFGNCKNIAYGLTGGRISMHSCIKSTYDVAALAEAGCIITDDTNIVLKTSSITN